MKDLIQRRSSGRYIRHGESYSYAGGPSFEVSSADLGVTHQANAGLSVGSTQGPDPGIT